jgi:hypothetical protein
MICLHADRVRILAFETGAYLRSELFHCRRCDTYLECRPVDVDAYLSAQRIEHGGSVPDVVIPEPPAEG